MAIVTEKRKVGALPSDIYKQLSYDTDGNLEYVGYADKRDSGDDENEWMILRLSYTTGNLVKIQSAFGSWTNRASLTYT